MTVLCYFQVKFLIASGDSTGSCNLETCPKQIGILHRLPAATTRIYLLIHRYAVSFSSDSIRRYEMLKIREWIIRLNAADDR